MPGTTIPVHAVGQPFRTATATLTIQGRRLPRRWPSPRRSPGRYDGNLTLPVGATHLDGVSVTLTDAVGTGTGHVDSVDDEPRTAGGRLRWSVHLTTTGFHGKAVTSSARGWLVGHHSRSRSADPTRSIGVRPGPTSRSTTSGYSDGQVLPGPAAVLTVAAGQVLDLPARPSAAAAQVTLTASATPGRAARGRPGRLRAAGAARPADHRPPSPGSTPAGDVSLVAADARVVAVHSDAPLVTRPFKSALNNVALPLGPRAAASLSGTVVPRSPASLAAARPSRSYQQRGAPGPSPSADATRALPGRRAVRRAFDHRDRQAPSAPAPGPVPVTLHGRREHRKDDPDRGRGRRLHTSSPCSGSRGQRGNVQHRSPWTGGSRPFRPAYTDAPTGSVSGGGFGDGGPRQHGWPARGPGRRCAPTAEVVGFERGCATATLPASSTAVPRSDLWTAVRPSGRTVVQLRAARRRRCTEPGPQPCSWSRPSTARRRGHRRRAPSATDQFSRAVRDLGHDRRSIPPRRQVLADLPTAPSPVPPRISARLTLAAPAGPTPDRATAWRTASSR